jgi:hypothetical protein
MLTGEPGHPGDGESLPGSGALRGLVGGNPPGDAFDGMGISGRSLWDANSVVFRVYWIS